jgi:hypothetical protein
VTRRLAPVLALLVGAACSSGGSGSSAPRSGSTQSVPEAQQLPLDGTVRYSGRIYTVAAPGSTLKLDDVSLRIDSISWRTSVPVPVTPPGAKIFGVFRVTMTNLGSRDATVLPTQIWLLDAGNHPYIAAAGAGVPQPLIGKPLAAGASVTGTLVYAVPKRIPGGLLVYRLADAQGIAKAQHVGLLRYGR